VDGAARLVRAKGAEVGRRVVVVDVDVDVVVVVDVNGDGDVVGRNAWEVR
jgi:hypothetical protein